MTEIPRPPGDASRMATILDLESEPQSGTRWESRDLGAMLRHQLGAPLRADLLNTSAELAARFDAAVARAGAADFGSLTFGALLTHLSPPLELLVLVKDFAKAAMSSPEAPLPDEVATILYYASIVAALHRHGQRITGLDDAALRQGIEWARGLDWVTEPLKTHLAAGLSR